MYHIYLRIARDKDKLHNQNYVIYYRFKNRLNCLTSSGLVGNAEC